jgi:uncharacterized protein (TIGR03085 family)
MSALRQVVTETKNERRTVPTVGQVSNYVTAERHALTETLRTLGPEAPTLCTGWDTRLLLGHLIRRERSLVELGARAKLPVMSKAAELAMARYVQEHSYESMLETFVSGPPPYSLFGFPPAQQAINLLEYVIHHEDCRRGGDAQAAPRELSPGFEQAVFNRLKSFARITMRNAPVTAELQTPDGPSFRVGRGEPQVTVTGPPVELALVAFGRQASAQVDYSGDAEAVAALAGAKLGT